MLLGYIPGVWDLLHAGHVAILERARSLCDRLVVGVPSDGVVLQDKGQLPIVSLQDRVHLLEALCCVDIVLPYYKLEFLTHLELLKPDILFVGETWGSDTRHVDAERWTSLNHCRLIRLPYTRGISTTQLKERICGQ